MNNRGFTLIEMVLVVAIISILAGIAIPAFSDQLQKSRRSDAKTALLGLQQAQEKLRANCNVYGRTLNASLTDGTDPVSFSCVAGDSATSALRYSSTSPEGWYNLVVTSADATGYVAVATVDNTGKQAGDVNCLSLVLRVSSSAPNGTRTSTNAITATDGSATGPAGTESTEANDACW